MKYNVFLKKKFFGNTEIKTILDIIIELKNIRGYKNKIFLLTGLSETGKTFSLTKLSFILGKNNPFVFSSGSLFNSLGKISTNLLNKLARKSIGVKFYQENLIVKGKLSRLETYELKNSSFCNFAKLTLRGESLEKTYDISEDLLKKIIKNKIKLGDKIIINRTNGDIYRENTNESICFIKKEKISFKSNDFEKIVITEQIITLDELDNLNQNHNFLRKFFSNQYDGFNNKKKNNLDKILSKWAKGNKIKIVRGILAIDDINFLSQVNFSFLKNLLAKYTCPIVLCIGNTSLSKDGLSSSTFLPKLPIDFICSNLVAAFKPIDCKEVFEIIKYTCLELNICLKKALINFLVKIGIECGIKYSMYLLSISSVLKKKNFIKINDIKKSYNFFFNCKRCIIFTKCQHFKIFY